MAFAPRVPESAPDSTPSSVPPGEWERVRWWATLYSWAQVVLIGSVIVGAHLFPIMGEPWSTCLVAGRGVVDWACVALFHIYEVPLVALFAYHAYWGFAKLTRSKLPYYVCVTAFQLVMLFVFATFESRLVLDGLARPAPMREIAVLYFACTGMVAGSGFGFYILFGQLLPALLADWRARVRQG